MQDDSSVIVLFKSATRRAMTVKVMLVIYFICAILSIIVSFRKINIYSGKTISQLNSDMDILKISQLSQYAGLLQLSVFCITVIFFSLWIFRIYQNMSALEASDYLRMTPGWAVGWYFVPIANLFKPYQGMKDVWNACDTEYDKQRGHSLIKWWWIIFLLSHQIFSYTITPPTMDNVILNLKISTGLAFLDVISTVLAFILVTRLTKKQEKKRQTLVSNGDLT
ncbi:DUF4328 domain-containing protein [Shimazuella kribbensis]|uniref:DUF4328 domain-containing protein n=1 Tax=Shimazuella kribbensis TaxID=139808 RepID=UPI000422DAF6|nr:DUF4328 domain-containing protein [Shimazuella kribbensis]